MTDERKAFEAWAISRAYSLNKNVVFGNYVDGNVEFAWQVWQARGTQQGPVAPMTYEQRQELVKECGLDWHRGFMPLFDGDPTNRYAVLIAAVAALYTSPPPQPDAADELDRLTTELAAAKKDATAARANLAWIAKNIEGANYDRWTERAGIAEDAKAILRRQRKPDSDELQYLALYDAATGI